jgi:predicted Zn-dependent protease
VGREGRAEEPLLRRAVRRAAKKDPTPRPSNMSLVLEGSNQSVEQMIKSTRRGLLVSFFWYIRASISRRCSTRA